MSLESFFEPEMVNEIQTLDEKIKQRRTQMLIHCYLYYVLDKPIISDDKWQQWADELVQLQNQKLIIGFYDDAFKDWSGATGMHLPFDKCVKNKAIYINKTSVVDNQQ